MADHDGLLTTLELKAAPGNAALVVVDVQNDFVADDGFFAKIGADMTTIQRAIPPLQRLIAAAREAGVLVVFVQAIYDQQYRSAPMRERDRRRTIDIPRCETGTWGADFFAVRPAPGEPVVIKHRYSGVINTELDGVLKRHGVQSLLMTGVATDTCVESTARDAYFIDYYVTLVADCCAAFNAADHQGALARFERDYGPVVSSGEIIAAWERSGARRPIAARAG
jgi:ureidoacrylate peracid hydrolase